MFHSYDYIPLFVPCSSWRDLYMHLVIEPGPSAAARAGYRLGVRQGTHSLVTTTGVRMSRSKAQLQFRAYQIVTTLNTRLTASRNLSNRGG
jgi:hypothetical protein